MRPIVLDAGAFIAAERFDRTLTAFIKAAAKNGIPIYVPAPVVAEVWRRPPPANAASVLGLASVIPLDVVRAQQVGELLGAAVTTQVIDAAVAALAIELAPSLVLSSDVADIEHLVRTAGVSCSTRGGASARVLVEVV